MNWTWLDFIIGIVFGFLFGFLINGILSGGKYYDLDTKITCLKWQKSELEDELKSLRKQFNEKSEICRRES